MTVVATPQPEIYRVNCVDLDPIIEHGKMRFMPTEDRKEIHIGSYKFHTIKLATTMTKAKEEDLDALLKKNIYLFTWTLYDMLEIGDMVVCHRLTIISTMKLMVQRKHKVGKEKQLIVDEDVRKLKEVGSITETNIQCS